MNETTFFTVGIACIIAAIVGGGFRGMGIEIPAIHTLRRQLILAAVGITLISIGGLGKWHDIHPGVNSEEELTAGLAAYDRHDFIEAIKHLEKSARADKPEGQYHYGSMLFSGEGVLADEKKGFEWIMKSAKQGYAPAQALVAASCFAGRGTAVEKKEALRWARLSANQQDVCGLYVLASIVESESERIELLGHAAEKGYAPAQLRLGSLLENQIANGPFSGGKLAECGVLYRKAALQGHPAAQARLAHLLVVIAGKESENENMREDAYVWYLRALRSSNSAGWTLPQKIRTIVEQDRDGLEKALPLEVAIRLRAAQDDFIPAPEMPYRHGDE